MERHPRLRILLCAVLVITATTVFARKHETGFLDRTVSVNGEVHRYQVYVPQDFDAKKKWPVILFLHGMGERGNDGIFPTDVGIAHAIRENASRFPFIVVIPQCRNDKRWIHPEMEAQALAAPEQSVKEFRGARSSLPHGVVYGGIRYVEFGREPSREVCGVYSHLWWHFRAQAGS